MKYKDQELLAERLTQFKTLDEKLQNQIIEDMILLKEEADYEYSKINSYTAPEEIERRTQSKLYYDEFLERVSEDEKED